MPNILDAVREEFFSRLQTQTNWGRNQIKELYTQCERDILSEQLTDDYIRASRIVRDISKPPTRNLWREVVIDDLKPDFEGNPFHNDNEINKGL